MGNVGINDLAERVVMLSARVYPLFRQVFKDYHPDEIAVLHVLRVHDGELQRRKLIKVLGINPKVVSRRVRNLVNRGLVESYRGASSARESVDKITKKGNEEFGGIRNKMKLLLKQGFVFVGKEEQRILEKIVKQANDKLEEIANIVNRISKL